MQGRQLHSITFQSTRATNLTILNNEQYQSPGPFGAQRGFFLSAWTKEEEKPWLVYNTRGMASKHIHAIGYPHRHNARIFASRAFLARGVGQLEITDKDKDCC